MRIGLDIGSTTIKAVVIDDNNRILYKKYERHYSQITKKAAEMLRILCEQLQIQSAALCISGSAGMGFANTCQIPFVQEVYATRVAVDALLPNTDVVIELGGEDAKILFLSATDENSGKSFSDLEVRMNGSCAGGTGAFIDQMATLLNITSTQMDELAAQHEKIYTIASRCGVFAKSDIQSLLNQGALKKDIAASIFAAVVNQTIAGLAQGRPIKGKVVFLGGPLTFLSQLRKSFDEILNIEGVCPENSLYYVGYGTALMAEEEIDLIQAIKKIENYKAEDGYLSCEPLFKNYDEYKRFTLRHEKDCIPIIDNRNYAGNIYVGIDAGSTTVKAVVTNEEDQILYSEYRPNGGNPIPIVKEFLQQVYTRFSNATIKATAVTGYGEDMIKNAFCLDFGVVETVAHFTAAKKFQPEVDFIIDIGGQDIKCFKIRNGVIDNIFLNEACSSGCGSFLQTFAGALGYSIENFAEKGIFADKPVDLGSRCTVFMNSSVKQAQKDGATIENISAGLSISVVKNALYKVIRTASADDLGEHIVVQGGTFLNDAVLRAFEQEIGRDVIRPNISGLMGAYGCALYAKERQKAQSSILGLKELLQFQHEVKMITCQGCSNHCSLTINTFNNGRRFIGGNRCEKPLAKAQKTAKYNLYDYKLELLNTYQPTPGPRGKIGIPLVLNMYELYPFWHTFFTDLGFEVIKSPLSNRSLYLSAQQTIPSDTVCYPAKLAHGHIHALIAQGIKTIFYPCMSYNLDEHKGDNHFNCPVVAYYPEVIHANIPEIKKVTFIYDYIGLHREKNFIKKIHHILNVYFDNISLVEIKKATAHAFDEYHAYMQKVKDKAQEYMAIAEKNHLQTIVLAGRPYHIDPEINHGIDKLICDLGAVVITEDSICHLVEKFPTKVLNQWTYHARLYAAAKYVAKANNPNLNLVQLVSFGCGVDAITTDETRSILEEDGKIYTQIKIDEITNLGAVKIRLRSLFAAIEQGR